MDQNTLYSSLVDADYLDTEAYMENDKANNRGGYCSMSELLERFNQFVEKLDKNADDTPVNRVRRDIRKKCVEMAKESQGTFSLSVPTGGGKTLSKSCFWA